VFRVDGPVNLVRLNQLVDHLTLPALRWTPFAPALADASWRAALDMFERLRRGDMLLHHPFESFEPVIEFLRQAAVDAEVLAIKHDAVPHRHQLGAGGPADRGGATRQGSHRDCRAEGALRRGGQHQLAERLEAVGAQVVYGVVG
jgi:polyphosphate kinase